jgi:hypothetical protein
MTAEKEILATDLGIDGIQAWGRLYDTVSSKLEFDMEFPDGKRHRVPISQRRSLLEDPDRRIRKAAFEGGNAAWQSIEDMAAAALNAIAGTRLTLNRHRRVDHFLEIALFQASITRRTLDAMFEASQGQANGPTDPRLVRCRRAAPIARPGEALLGEGYIHGREIVRAGLSRSGKILRAANHPSELGGLGAPHRQASRRILHEFDAH